MDYNKILNPQVKKIKPSGIRKFFDLAERLDGVISLGVGEPDFATPWEIRAAGIETLASGNTKYSCNRGLGILRRAVCDYLCKKGVGTYLPDEEILITVGSSQAIDVTLRALLQRGDEVIIPQPSYVCYEPLTRLAGGVPVILKTKREKGFRLTAKDLASAITPKTKAVILPYPCNPTGAILDRTQLESLAEVLCGRNILILSDEIYAELTYDKAHVSMASLPHMKSQTAVIGGFSKAFSMTGWRLGYLAAPKPLVNAAVKIHQYAVMCAPTLSQRAAVTALTKCEKDVAFMINEYDKRRRFTVDGFNRLGLTCDLPQGTFYAFPSIQATGLSSEEFCQKLLQRERVALVPGTAFGAGGEGFVRASYSYSAEHIQEALHRISRFLKGEHL